MQEVRLTQTHLCWLCSQAVDLKTCRFDECGMPIHEDCYVLKIALASESKRAMLRKPVERVAELEAKLFEPSPRLKLL